ncbi:MAG: hypothetical protein PHW95_01905 [Patescibacteria group bacterium]|nr:hypothetical protein [Patescibacteria group bacterium]
MKNKLKFFLTLVMVFNVLALVAAPIALAESSQVNNLIRDQLKPVEDIYSPNQHVDSSTFAKSISQIIKVALGFLAIIFLVLILYAGFTWMTAAGNEDRISTAKKTMAAAIVGVAIVLSAYIITYFVIDQLLIATQGTSL